MSLLKELKENKYYTISFDMNDTFPSRMNIIEVKVLIKLENSMKLNLLESNEIKWFSSTKNIHIFDEIPLKYFRKDKLEKIENLE